LAVVTFLAVMEAYKRREYWQLKLLSGAYICFFMGDLVGALNYIIVDAYPYVFSAADVSYIGLYCFLIAIALELIGAWTENRRQIERKYRFAALTAPVVIIFSHIAYIIIYPDIIINYIIFCVPLSFLGYYTLLLFFVSRKTRNEKTPPSMYKYHKTVMLFLAIDLILFLVSSLGWYFWSIIMGIALVVPTVMLLPAAKKGVGL
jgi:hypothetical protein